MGPPNSSLSATITTGSKFAVLCEESSNRRLMRRSELSCERTGKLAAADSREGEQGMVALEAALAFTCWNTGSKRRS